VNDILSISAAEVSKEFYIAKFLPVGRFNGFLNMVETIRSQIQFQYDEYLQKNSNSIPYSYSSNDEATISNINLTYTKHDTENLFYDSRKDEIAVLLSGGVDSSVALKLLQLQGHKVRAYYLKIWLEDEIAHLNECPWEEDLTYARNVCAQLQVPLETLSLQREYWDEVVQYTFDEAKLGRTPNPDIMCNSRIKFGVFYDYVGK
jgi:asparagine synthetase B (glutamine-hydrolysing)